MSFCTFKLGDTPFWPASCCLCGHLVSYFPFSTCSGVWSNILHRIISQSSRKTTLGSPGTWKVAEAGTGRNKPPVSSRPVHRVDLIVIMSLWGSLLRSNEPWEGDLLVFACSESLSQDSSHEDLRTSGFKRGWEFVAADFSVPMPQCFCLLALLETFLRRAKTLYATWNSLVFQWLFLFGQFRLFWDTQTIVCSSQFND